MERITPAQRQVLDALRQATVDGWPARVRDVGAICGHASPSTTHHHLYALEQLGLARRHPRAENGGWLPAEEIGPHAA